MKIVSGEEMARLESWAMNERRIPQLLLMENAGRAVAQRAWRHLSPERNQVVVIAGKGNNGGDGLVAARHLRQWGADVRLFLLCDPDEYQAAARENWGFIETAEIRWYVLGDKNSFYPLKLCLETAPVAVDAIFGSGFHGSLTGNALLAVEALNRGQARVLAVDVPTGIHAATGQKGNAAVLAAETVTFAYGKQGLYIYPGRRYAGQIMVEDISLPREAEALLTRPVEWVDAAFARGLLPAIEEDSHKGTYGHVLLAAGSRGMTGAALLAARAALRAGAGLATAALPDSLADGFDLAFAEGMTAALPEDDGGGLAAAAAAALLDYGRDKDVLVFGPGMARQANLPGILTAVLAGWRKPLVLDAGGLWALARCQQPAAEAERSGAELSAEAAERGAAGAQDGGAGPGATAASERSGAGLERGGAVLPSDDSGPPTSDAVAPTGGGDAPLARDFAGSLVLTPHPGELGPLLGLSPAEVQKDRCAAARQAAKKFGAVVILKGASTLIADGAGRLFINSSGNAALATAGSGDVLAGSVAAWLAQ
ncbi:MAG: NAD(P)H-hydrate epimerase, partial [Peptococcaceae bacterium]|nr:NAD(P)H-hydrate epimerase [Peptococcaceae bacterium]